MIAGSILANANLIYGNNSNVRMQKVKYVVITESTSKLNLCGLAALCEVKLTRMRRLELDCIYVQSVSFNVQLMGALLHRTNKPDYAITWHTSSGPTTRAT